MIPMTYEEAEAMVVAHSAMSWINGSGNHCTTIRRATCWPPLTTAAEAVEEVEGGVFPALKVKIYL